MAPLGYHLELLSDHYFILTNEDAIFVHMNDVSYYARIISTKANCLNITLSKFHSLVNVLCMQHQIRFSLMAMHIVSNKYTIL